MLTVGRHLKTCLLLLHQPEEVIGVISGCMEVLSSSFIMGQLHCCEKQVRDRYNLGKTELAAQMTVCFIAGSSSCLSN